MKRRAGNIRLEKKGYGARPANPRPVRDRALRGSVEYNPMDFIGQEYWDYLDRKDRGEVDPEPLTSYEKKDNFQALKAMDND